MLTKIDAGLWIKNSYFKAMGCKGSTRMSIIKTGAGLVIYSPVPLDTDDVAHLKILGPVSCVIAPSLMHHMSLMSFHRHFPEASVWIADGLARKIEGLPAHRTLKDIDAIAPAGDILQHTIQGHSLRETVLFHPESATLIIADFLYNYQAEQFRAEKFFFRVIGSYGHPCVPFYHRRAIRDKAKLRMSIETISAWPIKRIIMSHGRIVVGEDAATILLNAWQKA